MTVSYPLGHELRGGEPRAGRGRAPAGGAAHREPAARRSPQTVRQAARQVRSTAERVDAARAGRRWPSSASTSRQRRYEAGLSTTFLVTQAQRDLAAGAGELLQAMLDHQSAVMTSRPCSSPRRRARATSGSATPTSWCCRQPLRRGSSDRGARGVAVNFALGGICGGPQRSCREKPFAPGRLCSLSDPELAILRLQRRALHAELRCGARRAADDPVGLLERARGCARARLLRGSWRGRLSPPATARLSTLCSSASGASRFDPRERMTARSMKFSSSRMLPGQ